MPHYAYLKLKMPGLRGVITVNGNTERCLRKEEHTAALATEAQNGLLKQHHSTTVEPSNIIRGSGLRCNRTAWLVKSSSN